MLRFPVVWPQSFVGRLWMFLLAFVVAALTLLTFNLTDFDIGFSLPWFDPAYSQLGMKLPQIRGRV
jgi:hypothetical protein